ncbi:MAG: 23S rRNA (adenine(2503)-C(2))-methyltransferase RlmN [Cytophagaceae bacterium]|nr:23S rRNA (adenine(2503)-C(2))-methyltransferase RlmN [Cytophagaceae bacterium]MDW8456592.1 23S rRNA (adenine(2503)-C(2))-methyltransferase RlmN [Cytophagaceae bacterium]
MSTVVEQHKKDIRKLTVEELRTFMSESGEPSYRANQVYEWLWKKSALSFDEMTNLSKKTRALLASNFNIPTLHVHQKQISADGTIKFSFRLYDGYLIEGVLIPTEDRITACISSQVGCSLTCSFCATGYLERKRNLEPSELYDQVVQIKKQSETIYGRPLTNIVLMGMGEPLLNYGNVLKAIDIITSDYGLAMSPKRITLSTAGIAKMIKKLGDDNVKFNLALSLHAANDEKRNKIMPINESNSLKALTEALIYFYNKTKNKITLEYILFRDFNDSMEDAKQLLEFSRRIPCKVNIIEYNPIKEAAFVNTTPDKTEKIKAYLEQNDIVVNIRRSRGKDIDAACGQLANRN